MAGDVLDHQTAIERAAIVSDVAYRLDLDLAAGSTTYRGVAEATFRSAGATFLEFAGGNIERCEVNGRDLEPDWDGARIALPASLLASRNRVVVAFESEFDNTGEGFHRFVDPVDKGEYLYTGFEPYQAHRVFPCFDQPDLRATYRLTVTAPAEWEVFTAGRKVARDDAGPGRVLHRFERTLPFSTYLLAVVAGPYRTVYAEHNGLPLGLHCRESLFEHMDSTELFTITKSGIDWFEGFFDFAFPFTKYDQVFVPEFNWGGMENVGCVTYTDDVIFRDPPTVTQRIRRGEYLLHELAHMWFGDLVTMKWWDDLWLNESFATFVAYLALDQATDFPGVWQDFNTRVKAVAYRDDQKPTTHPIAATVATTDDTFLNFDQITYGKGASVLRQLVAMLGEEAFRDGLRMYFQRHAFGNTTLADFLGALETASGEDLGAWSEQWLETSSMNTIAARLANDGSGDIELHQSAPADHPTLRTHRLDVAVMAGSGLTVHPARIDGARHTVAAAMPDSPDLLFPNYGDLAYVKVDLDGHSVATLQAGLAGIEDDLLRQQLWASLWEMVRDRVLPAPAYLALAGDQLQPERSEQILRVVTANALIALRRYLPPGMEEAARRDFVGAARAALDAGATGDAGRLWLRALIPAAAHPEDLTLAARLVDDPPAGVTADQEMRWDVALRWSAYAMPGAADRIESERDRDRSDRGERRELAAQMAAPNADVKADAWRRIVDGEGSLHLRAAAAAGFVWRHQADLLESYAARFFTDLKQVAAAQEWEELRDFVRTVYPRWRIDQETGVWTQSMIDEIADTRIERLLIEELDELQRALACRELAAAE